MLKVPDSWTYTSKGDTRACVLAVPFWLRLLLGEGRAKLVGLHLLILSPPPHICSGESIKSQESAGELAKGIDPFPLQHGTRALFLFPTPAPISWEERGKHLSACSG